MLLSTTDSAAAPMSAGRPARLAAELACHPGGGADVTFSVGNPGRATLRIDSDFHLALEKVVAGGHEGVSVVFVFPAPEFAVIPPGEQRTFLVEMGVGEEGEPGADLTARRLLLEAEVFLVGRREPAHRMFTFPGC